MGRALGTVRLVAAHPAGAARGGAEAAGLAAAGLGAALILAHAAAFPAPRFWAEDGTVFYARAFSPGGLAALLADHAGYLNLPGNAAGLAARHLLSVAAAPWAAMAVGLAAQFAPVLVLAGARDAWLRPWPVRLLAVLLVLVRPLAEEVWLNAANAQVHLFLAAALVLVLEARRGAAGVLGNAVLLAAPLSGPGPVALLPLAAVRLWGDRSAARWAQLLCLGAGLLLQALAIAHGGVGRELHPDGQALLVAVYVKNILVPLSFGHAEPAVDLIRQALARGDLPRRVIGGVAVLFGVMAAVIATGRREAWARRPEVLLVAAALPAMAVSYAGAIGGPASLLDAIGGNRYAVVSQAALALFFLVAARRGGPLAWPAGAVVAALLASGIVAWARPVPAVFVTGPDWRAGVAAWRQDGAPIPIWPGGWVVSLPPAARDP